jgi:hypothetical protein
MEKGLTPSKTKSFFIQLLSQDILDVLFNISFWINKLMTSK